MKFNYYLPVNIIFGAGSIDLLGKECKKYGGKVLIVTGENSTKKSGLLDKAITLLKKENLECEVFDKVKKNPLITTVYEGVNISIEKDIDVVLGLGGGSVMDASKSIAFMSKNNGDISDYIYGKKFSDKALPLILVPTTCGTGSEGNCFSVLTNPENNDKKSLRTNSLIAKTSIIDPNLMMTMPKHILASVGFDAMCHNMEGYISNIASPFTDIYSYYGIKLLSENLLKVYEDYNDKKAWESVSLGSLIGGMVINSAGVCAAHGLEHPASGLRDIVHGQGLAALTPIIMDMTYEYSKKKFKDISNLLGGNQASEVSAQIVDLLDSLGLNIGLSSLGIKEEDITWMSENALKVSLPSIKNNPREFNLEEIKEIYKKSM